MAELIDGVHLPSKESESADEIYRSCSDYLRERTRDVTAFPLLFAENINYGTRRNLYGLKPMGLIFGFLSTASIGWLLWKQEIVNHSIPLTCIITNVILILWWSGCVTSNWVKTTVILTRSAFWPAAISFHQKHFKINKQQHHERTNSMSKFHFLNVKEGDCHIVEHERNRVTMIDICNGNTERSAATSNLAQNLMMKSSSVSGNFNMKNHPTHPLDYLDKIGINEIWRFILTHPDMDHMDGLDELFSNKSVQHYWDSGVRRTRPEAGTFGRYQEKDWDRYEKLIAGNQENCNTLEKREGARFPFANQPEGEHDGLYILAPNEELKNSVDDNTNDASYVVLYKSAGGKILFPGDAHDNTWEYLLENHEEDIKDCSILVAPHHGRDSDMDFTFLKTVNPTLVLMGNAGSKNLEYDKYRNHETITNNQAGDIVSEIRSGAIDIFVENETFAEASDCDLSIKNSQGYVYYKTITAGEHGIFANAISGDSNFMI